MSDNPTLFISLKTWSRCGQEFTGPTSGYVCNNCRKPKLIRNDNDYQNKPLSPRERHVAALVGQAKSNKEIAWTLHLSEGTVKEYLSVMFKKLGVQNRTELALWTIANQRNVA
jgi:DNA-binding NarL/FixJ family response regulator